MPGGSLSSLRSGSVHRSFQTEPPGWSRLKSRFLPVPTSQIPLEAIVETVQMQNLLGQRKWDVVTEQFGNDDSTTWPFVQIGAAAFARGRAYYGERVGDKADADLPLAVEFTSGSRMRMSIIRTMGHNRKTVLKNADLVLETYRTIASSKTNIGSAD
jgi:hypothetical protein